MTWSSKRCPNCGAAATVFDGETGETCCKSCGFVIDEYSIYEGPEWRSFEDETERKRAGGPIKITIADYGMSTTFELDEKENRDGLSLERRTKFKRLKTIQSRILTPMQRRLKVTLNEITTLGSKLCVPDHVLQTAARVFREIAKDQNMRGKSVRGVAAACLLYACRMNRFKITITEISRQAGLEKKEVGKYYRELFRALDGKFERPRPPTEGEYFSMLAKRFDLNYEAMKLGFEILKAAKRAGLTSGKTPQGTAAAVIYLVLRLRGNDASQREVSRKTNVTEVTLRNRVKALIDNLLIDVALK